MNKVLLSLTPDDLKDLGVALVGHRRKLLDAIAALRAEATAKSPPPTGQSKHGSSMTLAFPSRGSIQLAWRANIAASSASRTIVKSR
jgi:SAM domain (Sterile alpha motif)